MPKDKLIRRRQILVDSQVQGAIIWRVAVYWLCFLLSVTLLQACWIVLTSRPSSSGQLLHFVWQQSGPPLLVSLLMLPILLTDCVRLTNRFAGPVVRLRRHLGQVIAQEPVGPLQLRRGDFWQSLADDYNTAISRLKATDGDGEEVASGRVLPLQSAQVANSGQAVGQTVP